MSSFHLGYGEPKAKFNPIKTKRTVKNNRWF